MKLCLLLLGCCAVVADAAGEGYQGSRFSEVRQAVFQVPYADRPTYSVGRELFGRGGNAEGNHLLAAARRTLSIEDDLYPFPQGRKLIQANGICFTGEWIINRESPYTGLLATGSRSLAISRASVTLGQTRRGKKRTFAFAVKLFPTLDPDAQVRTVNVLLMDRLSGLRSEHFRDAVMDNEPALGGLPPLRQLLTARRMLRDLETADALAGAREPDATYRPVTRLSVVGDAAAAVSPRWLRLRAAENTLRVDEADFRDELSLEHYPDRQMEWRIEVAAEHDAGKTAAEWHWIGRLVLRESVTSPACDNRLHFAHPNLLD
ncbi:MAG: hypothetical protein RQ826_15735 [Xanthomonadales bacterium]|nr:hypothetical protein [Xanthomonadales bacterium]